MFLDKYYYIHSFILKQNSSQCSCLYKSLFDLSCDYLSLVELWNSKGPYFYVNLQNFKPRIGDSSVHFNVVNCMVSHNQALLSVVLFLNIWLHISLISVLAVHWFFSSILENKTNYKNEIPIQHWRLKVLFILLCFPEQSGSKSFSYLLF